MTSGIVDFDVQKDYYQILGVDRSATVDDLKAAHIKLALKYHPDVASSSSQSQVFRDVSEAWSILSKPELRSKYDSARGYFQPSQNTSRSHPVQTTLFSTQRAVYDAHKVQNRTSDAASSRIQYDKWMKQPLEQRKAARSLPVSKFSPGLAMFGGASLVIAILIVSVR